MILFTQPSAVCETAAKWIDSRARLQFRFFLNLFNCLLTTNLSRRNNRSRTGPLTLFNFRSNCNRQWISIQFHVYSRYLTATRDVHSTTTGCKWLIFHFTTIMQHNQSAHTTWASPKITSGKIDNFSVRSIINGWVASNRILVFAQRFLRSPRGKHYNSSEGNIWRKVVSTTKKTILERDQRFFAAVLSQMIIMMLMRGKWIFLLELPRNMS